MKKAGKKATIVPFLVRGPYQKGYGPVNRNWLALGLLSAGVSLTLPLRPETSYFPRRGAKPLPEPSLPPSPTSKSCSCPIVHSTPRTIFRPHFPIFPPLSSDRSGA